MTSDEVVRARIDGKIKQEASAVLSEMGLTVSDAIRLMLVRVASEKALPFPLRVPNRETQAAIEELEGGSGVRAASPKALLQELNADD